MFIWFSRCWAIFQLDKESINFRLRECKFFFFVGLEANFGVSFWWHFLVFFLSRVLNLSLKNELQNWTQKSESWNVFPLHSSRIKLPTQGPPKQEKSTLRSRKFADSLRWLKIVEANYQCPSNCKMAYQRENQMNIPNFCSRMLTEHSNSKPEFFSYIEAASKWSQKPLYFLVNFWFALRFLDFLPANQCDLIKGTNSPSWLGTQIFQNQSGPNIRHHREYSQCI